MTDLDPARPPEERIQQALAHGPDLGARGRFGFLTRLARRTVGRAVKFERDFNMQIDIALLERLHEIEQALAEVAREADDRLRATDDRLRSAEAEQRVADDVVASRIRGLEAKVDELRARVRDAEEGARVATTIASGASDGIEQLSRSRAIEKALFVYDELTARPYMAEEHALVMNDASGRPRLGYRGVVAPSPLYLGFETLFRGTEALVRERQRVYLALMAERGPVVDLGCGRGEMLGLLAAEGIEARGVDLDEDMVEHARALGASVDRGDALEFLVKQEDASLGAIFSAQFIEHLPPSLLPELLEVARTKLRPEGVFVAETVNPHSPRAMKAFWIDPTHQHPLFPETMLALCRLTGFEAADIIFPVGGGDLETDLRTCGEYAVVAGNLA